MKVTTNTVAPQALGALLESTFVGHLPGVMFASVGSLEVLVSDITNDSKQVSHGSLYCCVVGDHTEVYITPGR